MRTISIVTHAGNKTISNVLYVLNLFKTIVVKSRWTDGASVIQDRVEANTIPLHDMVMKALYVRSNPYHDMVMNALYVEERWTYGVSVVKDRVEVNTNAYHDMVMNAFYVRSNPEE